MAIVKRITKGSALTHSELDGNFTELDKRTITIAEAYNSVLTFDKNKYTNTVISQSGAIVYSLAASGNVDGIVIRHKIMSDGVNPITFTTDFNVFGKSINNIYPSGLHIFYFNYVGGEVDVAIPTYVSESTSTEDTTAPSVPTNLAVSSKTDTSVSLTWDTSTDDTGVASYKIYQDGVEVANPITNSKQITVLTALTTYSFTVAAIDAAGNESAQSTALSVTTEAAAGGGGVTTYDALWSLDKIENPSYAGDSIQVRRLDGSATAEIGFVGDELDTAAIDAMASNDSVQISIIYDKTGNGNHLTFTTGTRPVIKASGVPVFTQGGRPAMKFSGLDAKLTGPTTLTAENGLSIFAVQYNDTTTGSNSGILGKWGGTTDEYALLSRHFASPDDVSFVTKDSSSLQNNLQSGTVLSTKALRLHTILYNNATSTKSMRIDGTQVGSVTADIGGSTGVFQLGGYAGSTNETQFISEVRLKKGYISDFATVETEIKTKYGIA